jgi:hypothetical protein
MPVSAWCVSARTAAARGREGVPYSAVGVVKRRPDENVPSIWIAPRLDGVVMGGAQDDEVVGIARAAVRTQADVVDIGEHGVAAPRSGAPAVVSAHDPTTRRGRDVLRGPARVVDALRVAVGDRGGRGIEDDGLAARVLGRRATRGASGDVDLVTAATLVGRVAEGGARRPATRQAISPTVLPSAAASQSSSVATVLTLVSSRTAVKWTRPSASAADVRGRASSAVATRTRSSVWRGVSPTTRSAYS